MTIPGPAYLVAVRGNRAVGTAHGVSDQWDVYDTTGDTRAQDVPEQTARLILAHMPGRYESEVDA